MTDNSVKCLSDCASCEENCASRESEEETRAVSVTLTTEDGTPVECVIVGTFDLGEHEYIVLLAEGEEDVYLYRYINEAKGGPDIENIEDDGEYEAAAREFARLQSQFILSSGEILDEE